MSSIGEFKTFKRFLVAIQLLDGIAREFKDKDGGVVEGSIQLRTIHNNGWVIKFKHGGTDFDELDISEFDNRTQ